MVPPPPLSAGADGDTFMDEEDAARLAQEKSDEEVARELQRVMEAEDDAAAAVYGSSAGATNAEAAEARRRALDSDAEVARKLQEDDDSMAGSARGGGGFGGGGGGAGAGEGMGAGAGGARRAPAERAAPRSSSGDALGAGRGSVEDVAPSRKEPRVGTVTSRVAADGMGAAAHSTRPDAAPERATPLCEACSKTLSFDRRRTLVPARSGVCSNCFFGLGSLGALCLQCDAANKFALPSKDLKACSVCGAVFASSHAGVAAAPAVTAPPASWLLSGRGLPGVAAAPAAAAPAASLLFSGRGGAPPPARVVGGGVVHTAPAVRVSSIGGGGGGAGAGGGAAAGSTARASVPAVGLGALADAGRTVSQSAIAAAASPVGSAAPASAASQGGGGAPVAGASRRRIAVVEKL
jgi:hypothetical protein